MSRPTPRWEGGYDSKAVRIVGSPFEIARSVETSFEDLVFHDRLFHDLGIAQNKCTQGMFWTVNASERFPRPQPSKFFAVLADLSISRTFSCTQESDDLHSDASTVQKSAQLFVFIAKQQEHFPARGPVRSWRENRQGLRVRRLAALRTASTPRFTCFPSHGSEGRVGGESWNWFRQILVKRIAAFLLNLAGLRRFLVAMTIVQSRFFHRFSLSRVQANVPESGLDKSFSVNLRTHPRKRQFHLLWWQDLRLKSPEK